MLLKTEASPKSKPKPNLKLKRKPKPEQHALISRGGAHVCAIYVSVFVLEFWDHLEITCS